MNKYHWTKERRAKYEKTMRKKDETIKKVKYKNSCASCSSFLLRDCSELTGRISGNCHAHPPTVNFNSSTWPVVNETDWCKEFLKN